MKNLKNTAYWQLQFAVMLFGGASLFAKLVPLAPALLVWGRAAWAALFLLLWMLLRRDKWQGTLRDNLFVSLLLGAILAGHWVAFFKSIQLANVAVGVLTFSTFPVFTILLAPLFRQGAIKLGILFWALLSLLGVAVMLPFDDLQGNYMLGILWGLASALTFALLTLLNKRVAHKYSAFELAFWQNAGAALVLLPAVFICNWEATSLQYAFWILLGIVFTGLSHSLFVGSLKTIPAQQVSLTAALEPVYAIVWALLFLGEWPLWQELLGGAIILLAVAGGVRKLQSSKL
jgi:drug/metabolite transporter (DMT)-like permease